MILIISTCKEKLHELEFVKPIEKILSQEKRKYKIKHYSKISKKDLKDSKKIIIAGTSLQDNEYSKNINKFSWIKSFKKPILGICAGMQILGLIFNQKIKQKTEIGFYFENFTKEFLGIKQKNQVYHLHNNYTSFKENWEIYSVSNKIPQAVKHKQKPFFGVLFHPEVRLKKIIENFANLQK